MFLLRRMARDIQTLVVGAIIGFSMENRDRIAEKIQELNRYSAGLPPKAPPGTIGGLLSSVAEPPQIWQEFPGYTALTKFEFNNGAAVFTPSSGIPIKAFLNTKTGEIKTYLASIFEI